MKKGRNTSADAAELRRRAEERLRAKKAEAAAPTKEDALRLLHELQVHQIELELQNEELRGSRAEVEAGLERYTELYDFAPVGYVTLGRDGSIRQLNLAGASMLGAERARLSGRRFGDFVGEADRGDFQAFLEKAFALQAKEVCELALRNEGQGPRYVQLTATAAQDGQECRVVIADITARKQAEAQVGHLASFPMLNPRPIVEVDVAGHVLFCNPVAEQMFPDLNQRGVGHPWLADWEPMLRTLREGGGKSISRELHFDGKWYHQTLHFVDGARRVRIYGADITVRKRSEEALKISEVRYRRLFETSRDGILILDCRDRTHIGCEPVPGRNARVFARGVSGQKTLGNRPVQGCGCNESRLFGIAGAGDLSVTRICRWRRKTDGQLQWNLYATSTWSIITR